MALLVRWQRCTARAAWVFAWLLSVGSCTSSSSLGRVEVWLRDCGDQPCTGSAQHLVPVERIEAQALIDPSASRYAPYGLYAYFELELDDGGLALVEFDLPTGQVGSPVTDYLASYREVRDGHVRFEATALQGVITPTAVLGAEDNPCACAQGRFALRFSAPGPDGLAFTDDDAQRELVHGRLGAADDECSPNNSLAVGDDLRVAALDCALPRAAPYAPVSPPPRTYVPQNDRSSVRHESTVSASSTDVWYLDDSGGCGSGCGSSESYVAADDDSASCAPAGAAESSTAGGSDAAGCEGDSSESTACEGDDPSRESTACRIGAGRAPARARSRGGAYLGLGLPLLLCYLALARRARRGRPSRAD